VAVAVIRSMSVASPGIASNNAATPSFAFEHEALDERTIRVRVLQQAAEPMSFAVALDHLRTSEPFRVGLVTLLKQMPFEAFFWVRRSPSMPTRAPARRLTRRGDARAQECRPTSAPRASHDAFEFIVKSTDALDSSAPADFDSFREHLASGHSSGAMSVVFSNVGRDATLVVPVNTDTSNNTWAHLALFVRNAPMERAAALLQTVGNAVRFTGDKPLWISTSGTGVNYVHIRLDSAPKYYSHRPYKFF